MARMPSGMFDDKVKEVMDLLAQLPEGGEDPEAIAQAKREKEELMRELRGETVTEGQVLVGHEAAMAEYGMMMNQWDALVADYERREAEEAAAAKAQEGAAGDA